MSDKYNGWTNYETWLVNIWWGDTLQEIANEHFAETGEKANAEWVKDFIQEDLELRLENTKALDGFVGDLVNAAIGSVNFHEIAENFEYDEEYPDEEYEE